MKTSLVILIILFLFCSLSCKKNPFTTPTVPLHHANRPPSPRQPSPFTTPTVPLQLTVESITCTEAVLNISLAAGETQRALTLYRGNSTIATMTMTGSDSVFFDDGLLPGKTYTYTLASSKWNASAQATTMDTTSHNWTWEVDTLGIANSYLYDIAILNDTLAYAVGYIYLNDSTGKFDQQPYGVAVWNGARWQFKRVMAIGPTGAVSNLTPSGILAFSAADIWFANGGVFSWDGQSQNANPYWINAFQGNSSPILSEGQTAE